MGCSEAIVAGDGVTVGIGDECDSTVQVCNG